MANENPSGVATTGLDHPRETAEIFDDLNDFQFRILVQDFYHRRLN